MTGVPESVTLPCGCRFDAMEVDGKNTLVVTACPAGPDCQYVRYVMEEGARRHKQTTILDARE